MTDEPIRPPIAHGAIARAYEYQNRLFICSVEGIAETESISVLPADCDSIILGETIIRHLKEHKSSGSRDLSKDKLSDWQAFKVSGAKSVTHFESKSWHIDFEVANWVVEIWASPRKSLVGASVYLTAGINDLDDIGRSMRKALAGAKFLREGGIV